MNKRLQEIIKYKTNGKQTAFAAIMGWSPQYLSKLVRGVDFGLAPIITLIKKFPEINARWFLIGEGEMFNESKLSHVRTTIQSHIATVLEMEKYLPVMTPTEIADFEKMCIGEASPMFSTSAIEEWQKKLNDRETEINNKFEQALCKQPKAKK